MGLVNCVDCNKSVSDKAESCPNCGCPSWALQKTKDKQPVEVKPETATKEVPNKGIIFQNFDRDYIENYSWKRPEQAYLESLPSNYFWPDEVGPLKFWTEDISTESSDNNYGWLPTKSELLRNGLTLNIWLGDGFVAGDSNFALLRFGEKKPFSIALVNFIPKLGKIYIYEIKSVIGAGSHSRIKTETRLQVIWPLNQVSNLEQLCLNLKNLGDFRRSHNFPPNWVRYIQSKYPLHWNE